NRSEFASLDRDQAMERLRQGISVFRESLGGEPRWFCAPRWQQSAVVHDLLREAGFDGYMLRNELVAFAGPRVPLHALCFDEGPRKAKAAVARWLREGTIDRMMRA